MDQILKTIYSEFRNEEINSKFLKDMNQPQHIFDLLRNICLIESHTLIFGCNRDVNSLTTTKFLPKSLFSEQSVSFGKKQIIPHRVLLTGRRSIGKSTFCNFLAFEWSSELLWFKTEKSWFDWLFHITIKDLVTVIEKHGNQCEFSHILYECIFERVGADFNSVSELCQKITANSCAEKVLVILDGYAPDQTAIDSLLFEILEANKNFSILTICDEFNFSTCESKFLLSQDLVLENIEFVLSDLKIASQAYFLSEKSLQFDKWIFRSKFQEIAFHPFNLHLLCNFWEEFIFAHDQEDADNLEEEFVVSDLFCNLLRKVMGKFLSFQQNEVVDEESILLSIEIIAIHSYRKVLTSKKVEELNAFHQNLVIGTTVSFLQSIGLLLINDESEYAFSYLQFQEYLVAGYYSREFLRLNGNSSLLTNQDIEKNENLYFIAWNKFNPLYQSVWVYVSGILSFPEKYLNCYMPTAEYEERLRGVTADVDADVSLRGSIPVRLRSLDKYFQLLLLQPRDLFGMYELRLLIRCGEEAKWPENYLVTNNLLNALGNWIMKIAGVKKRVKALTEYKVHVLLPDHLSKLFIACPNVMFKVISLRFSTL